MPHQCHAVGCSTPVEPRMFMCGRHWRMLPSQFQKVIWHYYRPGQEIDKQPSIEYLAVAFAGIACVALQEGRTPPRFIQRREDSTRAAHIASAGIVDIPSGGSKST
jgi:hypothetical protein